MLIDESEREQAKIEEPYFRAVAKAVHYIRSIRNAKKQRYACEYLSYKKGQLSVPGSNGLSVMTAQAVRLRIDGIFRDVAIPEI